ncbi:MAG: GxxExxY protein [Bacteroidales bacterium]|nr:GxxExxY protein [Bacteroidales bacterium]
MISDLVQKQINQISYSIIACAMKVHNTLGPGLLESVYEKAMMLELAKVGLEAKNQQIVDIVYDGQPLDLGLKLDIIVNDTVIVELKSVEELKPVHHKQLFTYLKLSNKPLGLLINFNVKDIREGIKRVAFKMQ